MTKKRTTKKKAEVDQLKKNIDSSIKDVHLNIPQLLVNIVQAKETWCVWGRGTGKSEGVLAPAQFRNVHSMPRSLGGNVGATFSQILTRTLPAIIKSWENLGYKRDVHYFIGHYAPAKMQWPKPYFAPIDAKHTIHWYNGSGIQMISQDGYGMANGLSLDYVHGDEAKFLNYKRLKQEVFPINRGNNQYFSHLPEHHSLLFTTDRPTDPSGMWIVDKVKDMDPDLVDAIVNLFFLIQKAEANFKNVPEKNIAKARHRINHMKKQLTVLRMNCVLYSEASSLANVHALGLDYFKQMKRNLSQFEFETSILNLARRRMNKSFYPLLREELHTYERYNYSHFENVGYNIEKLRINDCRKDGDLDPSKPIEFAIDYGSQINIMAISQPTGMLCRILKGMYVKPSLVLKDLIKEFCAYYKYHKQKTVIYYYDHTAVGKSATSVKSYKDVVVEELIAAGWDVIEMYMGQAPSHDTKYLFWQQTLEESKGENGIQVRFNRDNAMVLFKSMEHAEARQDRNGVQKDKRNEQNDNVMPEDATHGSDAVDMLVWGKYRADFKALQQGSYETYVM